MTSTLRTPPRSAADRLARQVLRIEGLEPRALLDLRGSLVISAVRCVITYALVPALAPALSWFGDLATPLSLVLSLVATGFAVSSLRRVWLADWNRRWAYTAFIAVVVGFLAVGIAFDVRALVA